MVDKRKKAAASYKGKKATASPKANNKKAKGKEIYSMRCVQCVAGHRFCSRTKPCSICARGGRSDACRYPVKATLAKTESDEETESHESEDDTDGEEGKEEEVVDDDEDKEEEEEEVEEEQGGHLQEATAPDVEMSLEPLVSSQPEQDQSSASRPYQTPAWNVAMHFTRAQVLHEVEAMAADPTRGYINPRIRPDLDPSYAGPVDPQPNAQQASSVGDAGNDTINRNIGKALENSGDSNDSEAGDSTTYQPVDENDVDEEPYRNEAGELLDDFHTYYENYAHLSGDQANYGDAVGGLNNNEQPENGNEALGEQQELPDSVGQADLVEDGFFIHLPAFENNGPYTVADCSANDLCNERRTHWEECKNPCTYPCQEDHRFLDHEPHHVCHDCRVEAALYSVSEEENMIADHRLYMCAECTQIRAMGPEQMLWTHPRRADEIKTRKVNKCSCHDQLQKGWICEEHRVLRANTIRMWGPEDIRAFRGFFGGDVCSNCRAARPQKDGPQVMWQCAHCKDIVIKG